MKQLLLMVMVLASLSLIAQRDADSAIQFHVDSSRIANSYIMWSRPSKYCISYIYSIKGEKMGSIMFCNDSTMQIEGDTARAIGNMMFWVDAMQDRFYAMRGVVDRINLDELAKIFDDKNFSEAVKRYKKAESDWDKALSKLQNQYK